MDDTSNSGALRLKVPFPSAAITVREGNPHQQRISRTLEVGAAAVAAYIAAMGEIVNLKRARKAKARSEAETEAAARRLQHGQSKVAKKLSKAEREAAARKLDGHKRDDS